MQTRINFLRKETGNAKTITFKEITVKDMKVILCCFGLTCKLHLLEVIIINVEFLENFKPDDLMAHGHHQGRSSTQSIRHLILLPNLVLQNKGKSLKICYLINMYLANLLLIVDVLQGLVISI